MIVWTDLETTGLDHTTHFILEVAVVVTDDDLNVIDSFSEVRPLAPTVRGALDPFILDMHSKNGLLVACEHKWKTDPKPLGVLDKEIVRFLTRCGVEPGKAELGGSSVQFDRRFLHQYLPAFEAYLHYRDANVSAIRTFAKKWLPDLEEPAGDEIHRALPDIFHSISLAGFYRSMLFKRKDAP